MKYRLTCFFCLMLILSCQNASDESHSAAIDEVAMDMEASEAAAPPQPSSQTSNSLLEQASRQQEEQAGNKSSIQKKIIKDGRLTMEVEDLAKAKQYTDTTLARFEAYYENEQYNTSDYQSAYDLTIRVPSQHFEALLLAIESGSGEVLNKNIQTRDVTEEYVDLSIRLDNNREYLKRYNALLASANSVKDILEIQERTRQIEEEVDAKLGRLKYLDDRVRYSILTLALIQRHEAARGSKITYGEELVNAFKYGFNLFLNFLLVLVNLWPFLLLGLLLWIFRKRIRTLLRRKTP